MFYTVYKTTNLINGKFYIGTHKTSDPNDSYLGSGKLLRLAVEKYGREQFKKEVLFVFDNPADMFAKEAELVTEEFLSENNTYNLKVGGEGGFDWINSNETLRVEKNRRAHASMLSSLGVSNPMEIPECRERHRTALKEAYVSGRRKVHEGFSKQFSGKQHSVESKALIGAANSVNQKGERNSQYGSMWITDGVSSKKIKASDPIPDGWRRGRITSH